MKQQRHVIGHACKRVMAFVMAMAIIMTAFPSMIIPKAYADGTFTLSGVPAYATVTVSGVSAADSDGDGTVQLGVSLDAGEHSVQVSRAGFTTTSATLTVGTHEEEQKAEGDVTTKVQVPDTSGSISVSLKKDIAETTAVVQVQTKDDPTKYKTVGSGYTITATADNYDTVTESDGKLALQKDVLYTVTVKPEDTNTYEEPAVQTVRGGESSVTFQMKLKKYQLTTDSSEIEIPSGKLGGGNYYYGENVNIKVTPPSDQNVVGLYADKTQIWNGSSDKELTVSYSVTSSSKISATFAAGVIIKYGKNGEVRVEDTKTENGSVTYKKIGETLKVTAVADKGYYVSSITADNDSIEEYTAPEDSRIGVSSKTVDVTVLSAGTTLTVYFAQCKYKVDVELRNETTQKEFTVSEGKNTSKTEDSTFGGTVEKEEVASVSYWVNGSDDSRLNLDCNVPEYYKLQYMQQNRDGSWPADWNDTDSIDLELRWDDSEKVYQDTNFRIRLVPISYTITYHDPINQAPSIETFTVEDDSDDSKVTLEADDQDTNYTFQGWTLESNVTSNSAVVESTKELIEKKQKSPETSFDLYAVYYLNAPTITAVGTKANSELKISRTDTEIEAFWYGSAVTVTATSISGAKVTLGLEGAGTEITEEEKATIELQAQTAQTTFTASAQIEHESGTYIYSTKDANTCTVNQDTTAPNITLKKQKDGAYKLTEIGDDNGDEELVQSGVESVQFANISSRDVKKCEDPGSLKALLRGSSWTNDNAWSNGEASYTSAATVADGCILFFRAVDEAGNDCYQPVSDEMLIDSTKPVIGISYTYTQAGDKVGETKSDATVTDTATEKHRVYSSGAIKVTVTITDKKLMAYEMENGEGIATDYNGCTAKLGDNEVDLTAVSLNVEDGQEVWTGTYTIDASNAGSDLKFSVEAIDQWENTATAYTSDTLYIAPETETPLIGVTYAYSNNASEQTQGDSCSGEDIIYSGTDITATITVSGKYLDPFRVDADKRVTVKDNNESLDDVVWHTEESEEDTWWVGTVTISGEDNDESNHRLTVAAQSQAGRTGEYSSGDLVIDKKKPEISVSYENLEYPEEPADVDAYNNGNEDAIAATIHITDSCFNPYSVDGALRTDASSKTVTLTKDGGKPQDVTEKVSWTNKANGTGLTGTYNLPTDEGSYILAVEAADQAGNEKKYSSKSLNNDNTAPVVTGVTLELDEPNVIGKILNKLTFGNFFNEKVKLKVSYQDYIKEEQSWNSGVHTIKLFSQTGTELKLTEDELLQTVENEQKGAKVVTGTATYTLPADDVLKENSAWNKNLYLVLTDNVGNSCDPVTIADVDAEDGITSSVVLYETDAPNVNLPAGSFYYIDDGAGCETKWVKKDKDIEIKFNDYRDNASITTNESGLHDVCIEMDTNKQVKLKKSYYEGGESIFADSYTITYDSLVAGKNTISYTVVDNAGNKTEDSFDVYKDPDVSTTTLEDAVKKDDTYSYYDADTDSYWVRKGQDLSFTVTDETAEDDIVNESGLAEVTVTLTDKDDVIKSYQGKKDGVNRSYRTENGKNVYGKNGDASNYDDSFVIPYADMNPGRNTVTVEIKDNVGNTVLYSYDIYKDTTLPEVTGIELSGEGNNLDFGNFYRGDVTARISVSDAEFTSGIRSIQAEYVDEDGKTVRQKLITANQVTYAKTSGDISASTVDSIDKENAEFVFDWKTLKNTEGYLRITIIDNVGNERTFGEMGTLKQGTDDKGKIKASTGFVNLETDQKPKKISGIAINRLMFDEQDAAATSVVFADADGSGEADYTCPSDGKLWYNNYNINTTITVQDNHVEGKVVSGLGEVSVKINNTEISKSDLKESELTAEKYDSQHYATFNLHKYEKYMKQGKNDLTIEITDNAGRKSKTTKSIYVDSTNPIITQFSFEGTNGKRKNPQTDSNLTDGNGNYAYYFDNDTTVTVHAADTAASSGLNRITLVAVPAVADSSSINATKAVSGANIGCNVEGESNGTASFTVPANFKGWIYAYVTDNVKYASADANDTTYATWANPDGTILETQSHHDSYENHLTITPGSQNYVTQLNGKRLYKGNTTVTLDVVDTYAGIKDISYSVESKYDTANNQNYTRQTPGSNGWTVVSRDRNLITKATKTITVANNSNDIKITVHMTDNSGNTSTKEETIHIDKDAPQITVTFNPADEGDDPTHTGYFKTNRTMTVTIKERNFDPSLVKITATKDGAGFNPNSGFSGGTASDTNGIQFFTYTMTYTYSVDGDYTFGISATDKASHVTEDSQVNYGSAGAKTVAKKFTIDKTAPVITVNISGTSGNPGYYQDKATISVKVLEHNYDPNRYNLVFVMRDSQSGSIVNVTAPTDGASNSGDNWYHTYVCEKELMYQVTSVRVEDKAGNVTDTYSGSYNGESFVVDCTDPAIEFYTNTEKTIKLDRTATKDKAEPVIVVKDTNLNASNADTYTVQLIGHLASAKGNVANSKLYGIKSTIASSDNRTLELQFNNFAEKENIDDIYTLTVTATDKAGRTSTSSAMFSVNRYGSTYMVNATTQELVDRYYTNTEQPVEIIQINAAPISNQQVYSMRNMMQKKLTEGQDFTMTYTEPTAVEGNDSFATDSGWYECKYDIAKEQFASEGDYAVSILSNDQAENTMNNEVSKRTINLFAGIARRDAAVTIGEQGVAAPVSFCIDKTDPNAWDDFKKDKQQYFSGSHMVSITADDDQMLKEVQLYVDDNLYATVQADELDDGNAKIELTTDKMEQIGKDTLYHTVKVVAYDEAGNDSDAASVVREVQVTRDPVQLYLGNLPAKIITGILILVIVVLLVRRRRKENSGNSEIV